MRDQILSEIRRLANLNGGQPPGQILFARESGIPEHTWRGKFWARWGDAVAEAGFQANQWTGKLDSNDVLKGIITACRHFGRLPTNDEMALFRKSEPSIPSEQAIKRHFGKRAELVATLVAFAKENEGYDDIITMLPEPSPQQLAAPKATATPEGFVYLIKSGDFYKVGRSDDLERRVKEIRLALPDKASLVHSIRTDDPSGIEAYWHQRFKAKRANGEWFKLSSQDVAIFRKRKFQ